MKIQFTQDYRGSRTGPRMHKAKSVAEFDQATADYLVNEAQVAELVEERPATKPKRSTAKKPIAKGADT